MTEATDKPNESIDETTRQILKEQEEFHKHMSEEDIQYLRERGFEAIPGLPVDESSFNRPYFVISSDIPFRFKYGGNSYQGGFITDPTQSAESLAGMIEGCALSFKNKKELYGAFPDPVGQTFLVFFDDQNFQPVIDILYQRYNV